MKTNDDWYVKEDNGQPVAKLLMANETLMSYSEDRCERIFKTINSDEKLMCEDKGRKWLN